MIKPKITKEEMKEIGFMLLDYQQKGFLPPWPDEKRLKDNRIINKVLKIAEIKRCGHSTYDYDDELLSKLDVDKQAQFWFSMACNSLGVSEEAGRKGIVDDEGQAAYTQE